MLTARPASDCREDRAGIQLSGIARQAGPPLHLPHSTAGLSSLLPLPSVPRVSPLVPTTLSSPLFCRSTHSSRRLANFAVISIPSIVRASSEREVERGRSTRIPCVREGLTERECNACAVQRSWHAVAPKRIFSRSSY